MALFVHYCVSKEPQQKYLVAYDIPIYLDNEDWQFVQEVDGVINISKHLVTLSQYERKKLYLWTTVQEGHTAGICC